MESNGDRKIPKDILYDLISRFIINIPEDEKKNMVRICFQIEIAHWFYLDWYCTEENPHLKPCSMKDFTALILKHIPDMHHHLKNLDAILNEWKDYKRAVPTYGAIVLDKDLSHVLLVQSYLARSSWGFPKGKVNEEEPPAKCAMREVFEETGFDISNLINDDQYIEVTWNEQVTRLYLIPGVDRSTEFCPRTRMEIKAVEWFPLSDLPTDRKKSLKEGAPKSKKPLNNPNNFFMVLPFVRKIRLWVHQHQGRHRQRSISDMDVQVRHRQKDICVHDQSSKSVSKQQHMFSVGLEAEVQDWETIRLENSIIITASPRNRGGRKDRTSIKRQLFTGEEKRKEQGSSKTTEVSNGKAVGRTYQYNSTSHKQENRQNYTSESWSTFKFDKASLLSAFELPVLVNKACTQNSKSNSSSKSQENDFNGRKVVRKALKSTPKQCEVRQHSLIKFLPG